MPVTTPIVEDTQEQTARPRPQLTTAELAECTCPEFCERDHDQD